MRKRYFMPNSKLEQSFCAESDFVPPVGFLLRNVLLVPFDRNNCQQNELHGYVL